ncbi:MAG: 50S ribosomal protein L9 [Candidatus Ancillula sp.]|jgi:large subunit ribosomal protein L9|nr:50S ribosomal protein L9 [Candidatus Ancillula sp.]
MTKVILNQTVAKLGVAGDVVNVKPGYARNFLLPQNVAITWTERAEKQVELRKSAAKRRAIESVEVAAEVKTKLEAKAVTVAAKAGANSKLFGSITQAQIADAVKEQTGAIVDKRKILLAEPIKSTGTYAVEINLLENISATLNLTVVAASKK